jgi:DNA-binding MarR family transcriptional regulator
MPEIVSVGTEFSLKLEEFLPHRLVVLSSNVSRALAELCARHGLGVNEWYVLMTLDQYGEMTAKAIGARHGMHKTKVSRIVATLLGRGLISRRLSHADLRQALLHLTPLGKNLNDECMSLALDLERRLGSAIAGAEREVLDRNLTKLAGRAQQMASSPRLTRFVARDG